MGTAIVGCVDDPVAPSDLGDAANAVNDAASDAANGADLLDVDQHVAVDLGPDLAPVDLVAPPVDAGITVPSFLAVEAGLDGAEVIDLAMTTGPTLYALSRHSVLCSTNQGLAWTRLPDIGVGTYSHLAGKSDGADAFVVGTDGKLYKSTDCGNLTPVDLTGGPPSVSLIFASNTGLFAVTSGDAIYRLEMSGWHAMPTAPSGTPVQIVQADDFSIYLGTSMAVYKLTEIPGNYSWTAVGSLGGVSRFTTQGTTTIHLAGYLGVSSFYWDGSTSKAGPSTGSNFYADFILTTDKLFAFGETGITSWQLSDTPTGWMTEINFGTLIRRALLYANNTYFATAGGVGKGSGSSYVPLQNGLRSVSTTGLIGHPTDATRVYALTRSGFFRSTDSGTTWAHADSLPLFGPIASAATSLAAPDLVYVSIGAQLYRAATGFDFTPVAKQAANSIDKISASHAVASRVIACVDGKLQLSVAGAEWAPVSYGGTNGSCTATAFSPSVTMRAYAMVAGKFLESTDGGASFVENTSASTALPSDIIGRMRFRNTDGSRLYLVGQKGIYVWNGTSLSSLPMPGGNLFIYAFAVDPWNDQIMYLATRDQGLLMSSDGGAHWSDGGSGLPAGAVVSLLVHPADRRLRFAAPEDQGIYRDVGAYTP